MYRIMYDDPGIVHNPDGIPGLSTSTEGRCLDYSYVAIMYSTQRVLRNSAMPSMALIRAGDGTGGVVAIASTECITPRASSTVQNFFFMKATPSARLVKRQQLSVVTGFHMDQERKRSM
jgi:hypothetical protein